MRGDFTARSHLTDFVVLYVLLYGAFGAASPFLPAYIEERGIPAELIGVAFGAGTAIRLISAPIAGRIADRTHALRLVLAVCAVGTALGATDGRGVLLAAVGRKPVGEPRLGKAVPSHIPVLVRRKRNLRAPCSRLIVDRPGTQAVSFEVDEQSIHQGR